MNYFASKEKLDRAVFLILALLLFALPLFEAPKNILSFVLVVLVFCRVFILKDYIYKPILYDGIILLWLFVGIVVTLNAAYVLDMPATGLNDLVRYLLVGLAVSMIQLSRKDRLILLLVLIFGTVVGLVEGYFFCWDYQSRCIELNSVGHVNHSAIYVVASYGIFLSLCYFKWHIMNRTVRALFYLFAMIFAYAFYIYTSRAMAIVFIIMSLIFFVSVFFGMRNSKKALIIWLPLAITAFIFIYYEYTPESIMRIMHWISLDSESLTARDKINNFSYYASKLNPAIGIGFANYHLLDLSSIAPVVIEDHGKFNSDLFQAASHPHHLYYGYLVHGGISALLVMLAFWCYVLYIIYIELFKNKRCDKCVIYSGLSVTFSMLLIGIVNSTLHHENALLTFIVLGLFFSEFRVKKPINM